MRLKLSIFARALFVAAVLTLGQGSAARVLAQEGEPIVIDSVIAQVNSDVIMLSTLKREMKDAIEAFKQQGATEQKANEEVTRRQPEIIASLVNELLLVQKGKELSMTEDVETEVNREMLRVMNQQNFKTIVEMEEAMRREGIDPASIRQTLRTQFMKNAVLSREVDAKIFYNLRPEETKKYYETNRDKFRKPEVVTLSEIFVSLAGKPEAEVRARATQLLTQLRAGADFKTLASANSERLGPDGSRLATQNGGVVGTFVLQDLKSEFAVAIKNVNVGGVTDLIRSDEGYQILRVDARTPASDPLAYDEDKVREAITVERRDKARDEYMKTLRRDAYIKLAPEYQSTVGPLLSVDAPSKGTARSTATPTKSEANGSKKP
ncbi:MAG: peptidyl-prolyl cis-trans isomerase SurA [Acidobacteriota bacterium]|nr:peptidyl-prolyl cis-trans isomerase SurA [Acidobacteriota bacterium]